MLKIRLLIGVVTVLFFGLGAVVTWHSKFQVQVIQLSGNRFVETSQLTGFLEAQKPIPWVFARMGGLNDALQDQFQSLADVSVRGVFPHQIAFEFEEKAPWLAFYVAHDVWVTADDGTVLSQGGDLPLINDVDLMVVYGVPESFFSEKGLNPSFLEMMQTLMGDLRRHFPYPNLQIHLEGLYLGESGYQMVSWKLIKDDAIEIWMETVSDLPERFQALTQFFSSLTPSEETAIDYIDMRVPSKLIIGYDNPQ